MVLQPELCEILPMNVIPHFLPVAAVQGKAKERTKEKQMNNSKKHNESMAELLIKFAIREEDASLPLDR